MAPRVPSLPPPVIFVGSREPFERLVVILEFVLARTVGRGRGQGRASWALRRALPAA